MSNPQSGPKIKEHDLKQFFQSQKVVDKKLMEASGSKATEERKTTSEEYKWMNLMAIPFSLWSYSFVRRRRSLRFMIQPKNYQTSRWKLTNYGMEKERQYYGFEYFLLNGGKGIGMSQAILQFINKFSKKDPIIYIPLKGQETIEEGIKQSIKLSSKYDVSTFLKIPNFKAASAFSVLWKQLKSLKYIRDHHKLSFIGYLIPLVMPLIWMSVVPLEASWFSTMNVTEVLYGSFASLYLWEVYPFLKYCWTRGIPMVVFDDVELMALSKNPEEVKLCRLFYALNHGQLATVLVKSSNSQIYFALKKMPYPNDYWIHQTDVRFDPEYTYTQILEDEKTDFKNMKQIFLKQLLAENSTKQCFSNEIIRYFVLEMKYRELTLKEFKHFFDYKIISSSLVFQAFMKRFQDQVSNHTFKNNEEKQQKLKEIVKAACEIYNHQKKDQIRYIIQVIKSEAPLNIQPNSMIQSLGVEAQSVEGPKTHYYNHIFIKHNILKQEDREIKFDSKMKKIAFMLYFEEIEHLKQDELAMKKSRESMKIEP